jgi:tRNA (Thr-GGU) A37 N-methylase
MISLTMIAWGSMTAVTALVHTPSELYSARFFSELDAVDETPLLDVKPYLKGFAPRGEIREPGLGPMN